MQRCREIERGSGSGMVAYERRVEASLHGIGLHGLSQLCESDRLIAEGRQNFLMPQQALAVRFQHQHGLASPTTGHAGRMLNGCWLIGRDGWQPDAETRSNPGSALHLHGPVVLLDDFTNRREPQTVAVWTRREERLQNPPQRCFVHAPPRLPHRYGLATTPAPVHTARPQR